ncbi:unnamed protein product, partial [Chrysoparadoxa australica]
GSGQKDRRLYKMSRVLHPLKHVAVQLLVAVTWIEQPTWCYNSDSERCNWPTYPSFFGPQIYLNWQIALVLEAIRILPFILELAQVVYAGAGALPRPLRVSYFWVSQITVFLYLLNLISHASGLTRSVRIIPYFRAILSMCLKPRLAQALSLIGKVLRRLHLVWAITAFFLLFSAAMGTFLFAETSEQAGSEDWFDTYAQSLWSLAILLTSSNSPDVFTPLYSEQTASVLFFIAFTVLGVFLLVPFALAMVVREHGENAREELGRIENWRGHRVDTAFRSLDSEGNGWLPEELVATLLKVQRRKKSIEDSE